MDIYVMNKSFKRLGIIDNASVIWCSRYYDVGDFQITIVASEKNLELLKADHYVYREEVKDVGIIEQIDITADENGTEFIKASGRFLESILERRIVWEQTQLYGTTENGLRNLVNNNFINPTVANRKIDLIELGELKGFIERLEAQYTGDNILEVHKKVCLANQMGFKLLFNFDFEKPRFLHELYKGIDRSYNQSLNSYVVFSDKYDNLLSRQYQLNFSKIRNTALVAGEGEGINRKTIVVGNAAGLDRREIFVDARNLSTNNEEVTAEEYNNALKEKGQENLTTISQAFSGDVYLTDKYIYNKDFFLGDIVTIENSKWGIFINSRIIEIIEREEKGVYNITPTFGS